MRETTEIIAAIVPLIKYFISWSSITVNGKILEVTASGKTIRITHDTVKNVLIVGISDSYGRHWPDKSQFDLHDPRSIPATIRSACRRVGKNIPDFDTIDFLLENGIPQDVTDMWAALEK